MVRRNVFHRLSLTTMLVGLASVQPALAGGFALREQSAAGQGEGLAGVAAGTAGVGSMYWNPATMTAWKGLQSQMNAAGLFPYASIAPQAGTSPLLTKLGGAASTGDIAPDALLPSSAVAYQVNDQWWLGVAVNSPYGLTTKDPTDYAGQIYARTSSVRAYEVNPTLAYRVNDWLSVGAGPELMYFKTKLSQATSPLPDVPSATVSGSGWGWGFTAGATITPRVGTEIGVGYRSSIGIEEHGKLALGTAGTVSAKSLIDLPDQVSVGVKQAVSPDLTLAATYEWTHWSTLGTVTVVNPATALQLPFRYKDGSFASFGGDYAYTKDLTLRAGVGYDWSPISTSVRDLRLPMSDMVMVSAGAGYRFTAHLSGDLAYAHWFSVGSSDVSIVPGNPHEVAGLPFVGRASTDADVLSAGLTYRW